LGRLAIIGAGSWGTALSLVLAPRFDEIRLWVHDRGLCAAMSATRENTMYLPGFRLPENVAPVNGLSDAVDEALLVLTVVPSQYLRGVLEELVPVIQGEPVFVSATKGIENRTLLRMSEVIRDVVSQLYAARVAVLSGPSFAREVAAGDPAALVIASHQEGVADLVQRAFHGPTFRLYTNVDPTGVEFGAALKNVIAIGAGICHGLGLGGNAVAALVTRGLAEITRLAVAAGGQQRTLAGLAGLGDLVLTCTGDLSRNRGVGIELGRGRRLEDILGSMQSVAEGVQTTYAAVELAARHGVEMPIVQQMYQVLRNGKPPLEAVRHLMDRSLKSE
jgi:glycerol-3-phosphate dehydrogenase (NAD(P)+)